MGSGFFFLIFLIFNDLKLLSFLQERIYTPLREPISYSEDDVQAEIDRVDALETNQINGHLLVAKHIVKSYQKKTIVNDITFILDR